MLCNQVHRLRQQISFFFLQKVKDECSKRCFSDGLSVGENHKCHCSTFESPKKNKRIGVCSKIELAPYSLLYGQVVLLIICDFWTKDALIQTRHDVLFHLVHHLLHGLRRAWWTKIYETWGAAAALWWLFIEQFTFEEIQYLFLGGGVTFENAHQAIGQVLVEILNALRHFIRAKVLQKPQTTHWTGIRTTPSHRTGDSLEVPGTFLDDTKPNLWGQHTFLLDMFIRKILHCLWISLPGLCRFFKNSTKSLVTWSASMLAWRLVDGLVDLASGTSVKNNWFVNIYILVHLPKFQEHFQKSQTQP